MATMTVNGVNYAYQVIGNGEAIVLLHGFTGNQHQWNDLAQALSSDYQVVTVDLIGHGETNSPADYTRYSMQHSADDVIALLNKLGVKKFHLLGYSMGGRLALYIAVHHPQHIQTLILESASPGLKSEAERTQRHESDNTLADQIEKRGIEWFAEYWGKLPLWDSQKSLPQEVLDAQNLQRLQNNPVGLANSLRGMGTGVQPSLWHELQQVDMKTTLIVGEHDTKFRDINQEMLTQLPNATLKIIPNAGHNTHRERPFAFLEACREHFDSYAKAHPKR